MSLTEIKLRAICLFSRWNCVRVTDSYVFYMVLTDRWMSHCSPIYLTAMIDWQWNFFHTLPHFLALCLCILLYVCMWNEFAKKMKFFLGRQITFATLYAMCSFLGWNVKELVFCVWRESTLFCIYICTANYNLNEKSSKQYCMESA